MKLYVLDEDRSRDRRSWAKMIPSVVELSWDNGKQSLAPETPAACSVVVCHRLSDGAFGGISRLASGGVFAVIVAGSHGTGREDPPNLYHRGAPVGLGCDNRFAVLFARFCTALESNGTPAWNLVEAPPPPDALLAYHLLSLMPEDASARATREALRVSAIVEADAIAEASDSPKLGNIDDAGKRREFLRTCT